MTDKKISRLQQRVINFLTGNGWEENGAPNRLKKGLRRVYVGNHQTSFSTQTANGPGFFENVPTKDFIKVKTLV